MATPVIKDLSSSSSLQCDRHFKMQSCYYCRSQRRRGLRRRSTAVRPLRFWVRIPLEAWMFVCCECCVLSGRGRCDGLITRPEESYRMWCVVVCDLETSKMRRLKPATGLWEIQPKGCNVEKTNNHVIIIIIIIIIYNN